MDNSVSANRVWFDKQRLWVGLHDGRTIGVALGWYPSLLNAGAEQRGQVRISRNGLHWDSLHEDILIASLLSEMGDPNATGQTYDA